MFLIVIEWYKRLMKVYKKVEIMYGIKNIEWHWKHSRTFKGIQGHYTTANIIQ